MRRRRSGIVVNAIRRVLRRNEPSSAGTSGAASTASVVLVPLPGLHGEPLTWTRTRATGGEWRLAGETGVHAVLASRRGALTARTSRGTWKGTGDVRHGKPLTREGASAPDVTFELVAFGADRLKRAGGETLRWHSAGLGIARLETEDGRLLLETTRRGLFDGTIEVRFSEAARGLPDLDALVLMAGVLLLVSSSHAH